MCAADEEAFVPFFPFLLLYSQSFFYFLFSSFFHFGWCRPFSVCARYRNCTMYVYKRCERILVATPKAFFCFAFFPFLLCIWSLGGCSEVTALIGVVASLFYRFFIICFFCIRLCLICSAIPCTIFAICHRCEGRIIHCVPFDIIIVESDDWLKLSSVMRRNFCPCTAIYSVFNSNTSNSYLRSKKKPDTKMTETIWWLWKCERDKTWTCRIYVLITHDI